MSQAKIGSISHGTLQRLDLIKAFSDTLDSFETERGNVAEARAVLTLVEAGWSGIQDHEYVTTLVIDLMDSLQEFAPEGATFGAHPGDGSDFGFWPIEEGD